VSAPDIDALARARPRSRLVRWSLVLLGLLVVWAWFGGEIQVAEAFGPQRLANLKRFLAVDIQPYDLRDRPFNLGEHCAWCWRLATDRGFAGDPLDLGAGDLFRGTAGLAADALRGAQRRLARALRGLDSR